MLPSLARSLSLAGLPHREGAPWSPPPRAAIEWAARLTYRAVQLDGAAPGLRPRELDRSARRDLASLLRRLELRFSGIDLWIPTAHFTDPAQVDRAVQAAAQALDLAAELAQLDGSGKGVVSLALPEKPAPGALAALAAACDRSGASIADHAWPPREPHGAIGVGIDPAAALMAGVDPAQEALRLPGAPVSARLSDVGPAGRIPAGRGRLDLLQYEVALVTRGYAGPLIVDLRGVPDPQAAAESGVPDPT